MNTLDIISMDIEEATEPDFFEAVTVVKGPTTEDLTLCALGHPECTTIDLTDIVEPGDLDNDVPPVNSW